MLPNSKPRRRNWSEHGQLVSKEHFTKLMYIYNGGTISEKVKANNMKILDTHMTFARAMPLQCGQRNYDTTNMIAHELARRPASMFDDRGAMTAGKTKLFLRLIGKSIWHGDRQKVDGCAVHWVVPSPSCETRQTSSTSSVATTS